MRGLRERWRMRNHGYYLPGTDRWKRPWRASWLGRLAGQHSPSAHGLGECWCQRWR